MKLMIIALVLAPGVAIAQQQPQAKYDVAWYAAHPSERAATLRVCYSDNSYAHLYDCQNAASGENLAASRQHAAASNFLADPIWWRDNPIARRGAIRICNRPSEPAYPQYAPYCGLAGASEILARGT
jgi:hypothetical protein